MGELKRCFTGPILAGLTGTLAERILAQDWTGGRVDQRPVLVVMGVECRDAREGGGRLGAVGEILVAFEANSNADFGVRVRRSRGIWSESRSRPLDPQNAATAAYGHALTQGDLGGHAEREFDFGAFGERSVGEEKDSARAEVLRESDSFHWGSGLAQREREKIREPLSDTAFNPNRRSGHSSVTSFAALPKAQRLL